MSARAALRQILADYLEVSPANVAFAGGNVTTARRAPTDASHDIDLAEPKLPTPIELGERSRGVRAFSAKPALANDPRLRFNIAHAGARAVLAIAWEREVGIDLESVDDQLDVPPLLAAACTPFEISRVEALPPDQRRQAFLAYWTAKEAYLKAAGIGLFREPRSLEVELLTDGRVVVHDAQGGDPLRWDVRHLDAGPVWVAALAVAGAESRVCAFTWPLPLDASS